METSATEKTVIDEPVLDSTHSASNIDDNFIKNAAHCSLSSDCTSCSRLTKPSQKVKG